VKGEVMRATKSLTRVCGKSSKRNEYFDRLDANQGQDFWLNFWRAISVFDGLFAQIPRAYSNTWRTPL